MSEDDPVNVYLRECAVPPMTREHEAECVRHVRAKDERADVAMKDLVETCLTLVVAIAQKHAGDRIHILDLIQTGNQALITAAAAFADSEAEGFSAFATPFVENAIVHAVTTPDC
jgi:DNA-directed RNA polymerase sigma subunit (sigma70/sigma32)